MQELKVIKFGSLSFTAVLKDSQIQELSVEVRGRKKVELITSDDARGLMNWLVSILGGDQVYLEKTYKEYYKNDPLAKRGIKNPLENEKGQTDLKALGLTVFDRSTTLPEK